MFWEYSSFEWKMMLIEKRNWFLAFLALFFFAINYFSLNETSTDNLDTEKETKPFRQGLVSIFSLRRQKTCLRERKSIKIY